MNICFVSEGNEKIGMGHVMRCLSLAEAFKKRAHNVFFFSTGELGREKIIAHGFELISSIKEEWDCIVADTYDITPSFFENLKTYTRCLVYIDDLNQFTYPVDILVNGTASAEYMGYAEKQSAELLLGLKYNLLREEFQNICCTDQKHDIESIMITTGNSDPKYMTEKILRILLAEDYTKKLEYHVVVGSGFASKASIGNEFAENRNVHFHIEPAKMSDIMSVSDFAVTAGGGTLYELAACGVPAAVFSYADNQDPQIEALCQMNAIFYFGKAENIDGKILVDTIRNMGTQHLKRNEHVKRLKHLVDGKGTERIVKRIEEYLSE